MRITITVTAVSILAAFGVAAQSMGSSSALSTIRKEAQRIAQAEVAQARQATPYFRAFCDTFPSGRIYSSFVPSFEGTEEEFRATHFVCADVGLYQRYVLRMTVEFKMTEDLTRVLSSRPPLFVLREYNEGDVTIRVNGQATILAGKLLKKFGPEEFSRLSEARGDLAVIGVSLEKGKPVPHFERIWNASEIGEPCIPKP